MVLYTILLTILLFTSVSLTIVTLRLKGQLRQASLNKTNFLKLLKLTQFVVPACKSLYLCVGTKEVFILGSTYEAKTCGHVIKEGTKEEMWPLQDYEDYLAKKVKYQIEASRTFQQKCLMPYIHRDIVADPTIRTCYDVKQGVRTILDCKTLVTMEPFKAVKGCFQ